MVRQIMEFTDNPYQTAQIPLEDKTGYAQIWLRWAPTQMSWYFDIQYNNKTSRGNKLCLGVNILHTFSNIFPFGLMVVSDDLIEPYQITDFVNQRVKIYVLNNTEVQQLERLIYNE